MYNQHLLTATLGTETVSFSNDETVTTVEETVSTILLVSLLAVLLLPRKYISWIKKASFSHQND